MAWRQLLVWGMIGLTLAWLAPLAMARQTLSETAGVTVLPLGQGLDIPSGDELALALDPVTCAIVGMAACFTAVVRAPLTGTPVVLGMTGTLVVLGMTGTLSPLIPALLASAAAVVVPRCWAAPRFTIRCGSGCWARIVSAITDGESGGPAY